MNGQTWSFVILAGMASSMAAALPVDVEPALMMPEGAAFEIGGDGNFLVGGKPRFLIGNLYYAHYGKGELAHGPGYGAEHAWIYEGAPNRGYLQRLGFDTSGGEVSSSWLGRYRDPRRHYQARNAVEWDVATNYWGAGLPMVVDFTCATWSHGGMEYVKGKEPAERAFVKGCHFMYYSLVTPEGRGLWRDMWRSGAEELKAHGARPYVYELFNEPRYDDRSESAREVFAKYLSGIWKGDAAAMDAAWKSTYGSFAAAAAFKTPDERAGLGVAWRKFCEMCFRSGIKLGVKTIREVDPKARFCFQPLSRLRDFDMVAAAYDLCEVAMTPTGGGSFFQDILIRALADGRPIIDGESYLGHTRASHRSGILVKWARGLNACYYFKWERRMREIDAADPMGSLRRQSERFAWLGLNPAAVPPEELVGIMNAKRDIFAMQDLFAPRGRGIPASRRAAALYSMPTRRLGDAAAHSSSAYAETCAMALSLDAHVPLDAVFEEQLDSGRLSRYRLLVAAGIDATYEGTAACLEEWVKAGGTLVLAQEALGLDEWGNARKSSADSFPGVSLADHAKGDASAFQFLGATYDAVAYRRAEFAAGANWQVLAALPCGHAAVARRALGKGCVYYIGVRFPRRGDEGRLIASIARPLGILPTCRTLDLLSGEAVDGVEVHAARLPGGDTGFVVVNTTLASKAMRFIPGADFEAKALLDVSSRTVLGRDAEGAAVLALKPSEPIVMRGAADEEHLAAALAGAPAAWNAKRRGGFSHEAYETAFARVPSFLADAGSAAKAFAVDPARVVHIDLREVANAALGDIVKNPPWGTKECAGVPFEFMRPDQNGGKSAVALRPAAQGASGKPFPGIPVNLRAAALYFLHAGERVKAGDAARYTFRYSDGSSEEHMAKAFVDFGDVAMAAPSPLPESVECSPGWVDARRRGFWVSKWENPHPEKVIASIGAALEGGEGVFVAAMSAEALPRGFGAAEYGAPRSARPWGGVKAEAAADGKVSVDFAASSGWPGVNVDWAAAPKVPDGALAADFVFCIRTDGAPPPNMQVRLGKGKYHSLMPFARRIADGKWLVSVPLEYSDGADMRSIGIQRKGGQTRETAAKMALAGFRVVWRGEGDNPLELRRFDPDATDGARAILRDGGIELAVADNNRHWASLQMRLAEPLPVSAFVGGGSLAFEVNSGRTPLGMPGRGRQRLRVGAQFKMPDGKEDRIWLGKPVIDGGRVDDDPWTWQTVRVPLPPAFPQGAQDIRRLVMNIVEMPQDERSGIVFRNLRLIPAPGTGCQPVQGN